MSIASEIQDLNTNLTAAKNAVTAAGGTVGDTGLAGLASEIASIPAGSAEWGEVTYVDGNNESHTVTLQSLAELFTLGNSSQTWSATVGGESVPNTQITAVTVGKDASALPTYFCNQCSSLTSLTFADGNSLIDVPNNFCNGARFTTLSLPQTVVNIGNTFLQNVSTLTSFTFPSSIRSIGGNFCQNCSAMTTISGLSDVETIGTQFCLNCTSLNCPITLSSVTSIGQSFLSGCTTFNSAITIRAGYTGQLNGFLYNCSSFNQPITIPNGTTNVNNFLYGCSSFNQPLTIPSGITSVNSVLANCSSFNSTLTMGNSVTSAQYLLNNCTSFNQPITIGGTNGALANISNALAGCTSLNSDVTLKTSSSTTRPTINFFMQNCNAMTATVSIGVNMSGAGTNNNAMTTTDASAPCYTSGIKIGGMYGSDWRNACPNRTTSPYRNLHT